MRRFESSRPSHASVIAEPLVCQQGVAICFERNRNGAALWYANQEHGGAGRGQPENAGAGRLSRQYGQGSVRLDVRRGKHDRGSGLVSEDAQRRGRRGVRLRTIEGGSLQANRCSAGRDRARPKSLRRRGRAGDQRLHLGPARHPGPRAGLCNLEPRDRAGEGERLFDRAALRECHGNGGVERIARACRVDHGARPHARRQDGPALAPQHRARRSERDDDRAGAAGNQHIRRRFSFRRIADRKPRQCRGLGLVRGQYIDQSQHLVG